LERIADADAPRRLVGGRRTRTAERGVRVVDAGVEDSDPDVFAVEAGVLHRRRTDVGHGLGQVELVVDHARNARDVRVACQLADVFRVRVDEQRVRDHLHVGHDLGITGQLPKLALEGLLLALQRLLRHDLLGRRAALLLGHSR